jgi:hypothetical protein
MARKPTAPGKRKTLKGSSLKIQTVLLALASICSLALPTMVTTTHAETMKICEATWKGMASAEKAMTTRKAFLSVCRDGASKQTGATRPDQRLAPLPCHDYSDCTTHEVISDPK